MFGRPVLKRAGHHDGDRMIRMLFLERPVVRAGGTDHVGYTPAVSACERTDRNFCQEFSTHTGLQTIV